MRRLHDDPVAGGVYLVGLSDHETSVVALHVEKGRVFFQTRMGWRAWTEVSRFVEWAYKKIGDKAVPPFIKQEIQPKCARMVFVNTRRCTHRGQWHCPTHGWICGIHSHFWRQRRLCGECLKACDMYWTDQGPQETAVAQLPLQVGWSRF